MFNCKIKICNTRSKTTTKKNRNISTEKKKKRFGTIYIHVPQVVE